MNLKKLKKAAMFGLDARIALVVFATVSVISVASISHIISNSRVDKLAFELKQIDNAVRAYEVDTDSTLPIITTGIFNISELKISTKTGWKKPYIGYKQVTGADANRYFVNPMFGRFSIFQANDRSATDITDDPFNACADAGKTCYLWVLFDSSSEGQIEQVHMNGLDAKVDDGDGFLTGKVQKFNSGGLLFRLAIRDYTP